MYLLHNIFTKVFPQPADKFSAKTGAFRTLPSFASKSLGRLRDMSFCGKGACSKQPGWPATKKGRLPTVPEKQPMDFFHLSTWRKERKFLTWDSSESSLTDSYRLAKQDGFFFNSWMCSGTYYPQGQPFINGCFNWMIPNLYIGNGCFTKHLFINGCLGFPVILYYPPGNSASLWPFCDGAFNYVTLSMVVFLRDLQQQGIKFGHDAWITWQPFFIIFLCPKDRIQNPHDISTFPPLFFLDPTFRRTKCQHDETNGGSTVQRSTPRGDGNPGNWLQEKKKHMWVG